VLLSLAVALFIVWRQPELLTAPRFWAEEGTNYFAYAHAHSWWENLLHPQFGYYTLYNALATSLAATVPLEYAPAVTTWLALGVQVGVSAAVLWWRLPLLPALWQRAVVAFAIQFLAYSRIWLTTIGVQYFLCVLSFLILLEEPDPALPAPPLSRQLLLVCNGLTGVLSCFLIPAFLLKWRWERRRDHLQYAVILTACLTVQLGVFAAALLARDGDVASRLSATAPLRLVTRFILYQFVVPVTGRVVWLCESAGRFDAWLTGLLRPLIGDTPVTSDYVVLQQLVGLVLIAFFAAAVVKLRRRCDTMVIVTAFAVLTLFSTLFSVNSSGGPRYTYAPSVMLLVFCTSMAGQAELAPLFRRLSLALLLSSVLLCDFRATMVFAYSPDWPSWHQELARWRATPAYQLRIWPAPFVLNLGSPAPPLH
jgi:hypothetical protein